MPVEISPRPDGKSRPAPTFAPISSSWNARHSVAIATPALLAAYADAVGIGAIVGLRALPFIVGRLGKNRTVIAGLVGLSLCVIALGFVEPIANLLERTERVNPFSEDQRAGGLSILVLLTMAFAGPLGFTYALVNAPAQTVLHERAPAEMRGRVFAAQVVLANAVGILPLILAGSVADIFGVSPVLFAIALSMATIAGVSIYLEAKWSVGTRPPPPGATEGAVL